MSDPMLKLQILARAELALARIHARRAASRSVFVIIALVLVLFALAMLNVAAYQALSARLSPAVAALLTGLADALLAVMLVVVSGRTKGNEAEESMVREIRDMARSELKADVDEVQSDLAHLGNTVSQVREALSMFSGGAASRTATLLKFAVNALKRGRKKQQIR